MKRILAIVLSVIMLLSNVAVFAEDNPVILRADKVQTTPGGRVEMNINLENNTGILAALLVIGYDNDLLKLVDARDGGIIEGHMFGDDYNKMPFKMLWNSASRENFTEDGVLATLVFEVSEDAPEGDLEVKFAYKQENVYDVDFNDVYLDVKNGIISVVGEDKGDSAESDVPSVSVPSDDELDADVSDVEKGPESVGEDNADSDNEIEVSEPKDDNENQDTQKYDFKDVEEKDWFYPSVQYVAENGLMSGISENDFAPNNPLTRAMLVTILYRNEGEPTAASAPFADVTEGQYYTNAVAWASQNGIVSGVSEKEFAPDANITREQLAAIIYRYAQYKKYDTDIKNDADLYAYDDAESISGYAITSMQYVVDNGYIKGKTDSTLNPLDVASRAEVATILKNFLETNK